MARPAPTPPRPKFVRHALRPEWGIGCVIDVFSGLIRVRFADGQTREFREDVLAAVDEADVPPELLSLSDKVVAAPVKAARKTAAAKAEPKVPGTKKNAAAKAAARRPR